MTDSTIKAEVRCKHEIGFEGGIGRITNQKNYIRWMSREGKDTHYLVGECSNCNQKFKIGFLTAKVTVGKY